MKYVLGIAVVRLLGIAKALARALGNEFNVVIGALGKVKSWRIHSVQAAVKWHGYVGLENQFHSSENQSMLS